MKKSGVLLLFMLITLVCLSGLVYAQEQDGENQEEEMTFEMQVEVDSSYVRVAPSREAEAVASVFENDRLEAIGRNIDGTWFEVKRPGRLYNLGWIFYEMVDVDFAAEYLPLTDTTTGVEGPWSVREDPGFAVNIVEGVALRNNPSFEGELILNIPPNVTVPLFERDSHAEWLHVNYIGYDGWIIAFTTRERPDILDVPVSSVQALGESLFQAVTVIPPEVQLAQLAQIREYAAYLYDFADYMAWFWSDVYRGELMPCNPPDYVAEYLYSPQDVQQLPELERYAPRLNAAVGYLNASVEPFQNCGAMLPSIITQARGNAMTARAILSATLDRLDYIEENIIR